MERGAVHPRRAGAVIEIIGTIGSMLAVFAALFAALLALGSYFIVQRPRLLSQSAWFWFLTLLLIAPVGLGAVVLFLLLV